MIFLGLCATVAFGGLKLPFPEQTDIYLEVVESPGYDGRVFFFAPHENEGVANRYLAEKIVKSQGRLVILRQNGTRHVALRVSGRVFELDPNRMFTPRGAEQSLRALNRDVAGAEEALPAALERALALGRFVLRFIGRLEPGTVIVAVHNNTEGYDDDGKGGIGTVSIARYRRKLEAGARFLKDVHIGPGDEDDLFFITAADDFRKMKSDGWNVVLQHPQVADLADEDDGSLSVLAEIKGLRYINIEAERHDPETGLGADHLDVQKRMVDYVRRLLFPPADGSGR